MIEDDVIISWSVTIVDHNLHPILPEQRAEKVVDWSQNIKDWKHVKMTEVVVKKGAWIGFNAVILPGVTIGEGTIVGASGVVTKIVPDRAIVAGNPARMVRQIDDLRMEEHS